MSILDRLCLWWEEMLSAWREPFDVVDSDYPIGPDSRWPETMECPDTEPTSPGLLDSLYEPGTKTLR